jgi:hypothetical protein
MKKFIKKLLIFFIIPMFFIGISAELLLRNIPNDYSYKKSYLDEKSNIIEVLFLGSSHVYHGINPEYSKFKSFNAAHVSQSLDFDLAILEKYENNWSNLKYIVIPIDYFSMYKTLETGTEKWRVKNYSIYYGIHKDYNYKNNLEILNNSFKNNWERLKSSYYNNLTDVTCNKLGCGVKYSLKNNTNFLNQTGKEAAERHTAKNNLYVEKNIEILNNIIEFANKNKTKIIFFTSPGYKTYVDNL